MNSVNSRRLMSAMGLILALLVGCNSNPATHPVSGKVEFADGSPVMFGEIETLASGQPVNARGKIARDGSFSLSTFGENDGAVAGKHQVVITQLIVNHRNIEVEHDHGDLVAEKYYDYRTTDLEIQVEAGENQLTLVVDKKSE